MTRQPERPQNQHKPVMRKALVMENVLCPCNTEIGRWVTSYARGGHWIMDASPMMSFFRTRRNGEALLYRAIHL